MKEKIFNLIQEHLESNSTLTFAKLVDLALKVNCNAKNTKKYLKELKKDGLIDVNFGTFVRADRTYITLN